MYRNTYALISLSNISHNIKVLKEYLCNYKYYIAVVKANCYSHHDIKVIKTMINSGINYLAVATLDEALEIRKKIKKIPILCLGVIPAKYINICVKNNITITINSLNYLKEIIKKKIKGIKEHIKINSGMNRLGINNSFELNKVYRLLKDNNVNIEGIYTHMCDALNKKKTMDQFETFENITKDINLYDIPIIHLCASESLIKYNKKRYVNGCRLGIAMYGLMNLEFKNLLPTFKLISEVIQINKVKKGETVGYLSSYKTKRNEYIAVVSIGYADGIIRSNKGRNVYINNKPYPIVGNICMDMLFVRVDEKVKVHDKVEIIKDINHIKEIAKHLKTNNFEVLITISNRVPRICI